LSLTRTRTRPSASHILTHCFSLSGVKNFDVNLESQTANVTTEPALSYDTVLATIKKTGKAVTGGEADGQTMSV
jgi:copper chaperone